MEPQSGRHHEDNDTMRPPILLPLLLMKISGVIVCYMWFLMTINQTANEYALMHTHRLRPRKIGSEIGSFCKGPLCGDNAWWLLLKYLHCVVLQYCDMVPQGQRNKGIWG